ncbi:MAG: YbbR-like domain-containing protein [Deltaproteobacteria bacterium]|nr:YbbR-like domain-containing protein [Deltaproteobacteria bacterium]
MRWRGSIRKDWVIKLLSLGFALLLWFFVVGEQKAEVNVSIPLELVNIPADLVIANDIPSNIDVRVYGPRSMIRAMATKGVFRVIDLKDATPGKTTVHLSPDSLSLPGAVRALRIQPSNVEIVLEPLVLSDFPVKPVLKGMVAKYHKVLDTDVFPSRVVISGPESIIKAMKEIRTFPIIREVGLDLQGLHVLLEEKGTYKVTVHIVPAQGTRRITHIPVQIETSKSDVLWWPRIVSVTLRGPMLDIREIKVTDIYVGISVKGLEPGVRSVKPECIVPEGFTLMEITPKNIKVNIPEEKIKELKIED